MTHQTQINQNITPASLKLSGTVIYCRGHWTLEGIYEVDQQVNRLDWPTKEQITLDGGEIQAIDTAGAWLLYRTKKALELVDHSVILKNFNPEQQSLLDMMSRYATHLPSVKSPRLPDLLQNTGEKVHQGIIQGIDFLSFIGETTSVFFRQLLSPGRIRWKALFANLQTAGVNALPIVSLMSFLIGIVIAYQGGVQLSRYGANIFIVDLVGITLLREIAPLLTAIIVAGRSGSAFAAQIGTMHLTEEIAALKTMGIAPMELLVLPKLLALMIALPLLSAWADVMGIVGSIVIAQLALEVSTHDFLERLPVAVSLTHYVVGVAKAPVFAAVIALVGCYQGFQVSGSAESVGRQVTTSVVQAIFLVLVVDALFSIIFSWFSI